MTRPKEADRSHRLGPLSILAISAAVLVVALLIYRALTHAHEDGGHEVELPRYWGLGLLSFIGILTAIALLPLIHWTHHWWESNLNRLLVSLALSAVTLLFYIWVRGIESVPVVLEHAVVDEYIPFIVLLFSLYVISGGISIKGDLPAHPATNTAFLALGTLIASVIGTTGASMLLIRPLLQTNSERKHVTHTVVFFIFLVSNIGGCLLPIGDPPLFLGYLKGVPFLWTLTLWKEWAFCSGILLVTYYIWDSWAYKRESVRAIRSDEAIRKPLRMRGWINLLWLLGVVLAVAMLDWQKPVPGTTWTPFRFMRELLMLGLVGLSLLTTPAGVRKENRFNYAAILEVAALFIGIFVTMQVPIEVLHAKGAELGLSEPWQFFWATGSLSSFLDNAPTYVVFFETANAMTQSPGPGVVELIGGHYVRDDLLVGISLGAVFMGANTYIGNGPNFMVKSIAEQSGIAMPGFFGFLFKYSVPVLVPLFILVTLVFLL